MKSGLRQKTLVQNLLDFKEYLDTMLESSTLEQWDVAYNYAKDKLHQYPKKPELLEKCIANQGIILPITPEL